MRVLSGEVTHEGPCRIVLDGGQERARVVPAQFTPTKSTFVTPGDFQQQLGYIVYAAGEEIRRHRHRPIVRTVVGTNEVVLVRSGRCVVEFFGDTAQLVAAIEVTTGDVVVFVSGGHGFRMIEDTILIEIKQGPYSPDADKIHF